MTIRDCGIQIVRDEDGYLCGRGGSELCSDCGTMLCDRRAEACQFCLNVYCDCRLYFHLKEPHTREHVGQSVPEHRPSAQVSLIQRDGANEIM